MNIGLDWIGLIGLALDGICLHVLLLFFFCLAQSLCGSSMRYDVCMYRNEL
jgi:hypothetical protein